MEHNSQLASLLPPSKVVAAIIAIHTLIGLLHADLPTANDAPRKAAAVSTLRSSELDQFDACPKPIQAMIETALSLTRLNLTYLYGSSDPNRHGMDCSGAIYHVLQQQGFKEAPRQSDELCLWFKDSNTLHRTPTGTSIDHDEFKALKPGDLVFWTGTTATERKLPITHVMLYLGRLKANRHPLIFGASDGRRYAGQSRCGVSVFDLEFPNPGGKSAIYGYGSLPGMAAKEVVAPGTK